MTILHLACLNNDPEKKPFLGLKCAPVGEEPPASITKLTVWMSLQMGRWLLSLRPRVTSEDLVDSIYMLLLY